MKKLIALALTAAMMLSLAACSTTGAGGASSTPAAASVAASTATTGGKKVGIAMPTQSSQRWIQDGSNLKSQLEALGYTVDLQYAEDDVQAQVSQIENMITSGANCLVVASIDSQALVNVLAQAKDNGIPFIAYDRLLMDTDAVSYYATFDNFGVGVEIAKYVEAKMDLANGAGPYNIEFFAGSPDDNNAHLFNDGVFSVLQKYLDNGQLVCQSGQTDFEQTAILRWSQETAQKRMEDLLAGYYSQGENVDIALSMFDGFSYGIAAALEGAGYKVGEQWPVITGQDAELMACKNIMSGKQSQTIYKDTRVLAEKCVGMVQAVLEGGEPEINDSETYNNNVKVVPSYLCTPVSVDESNLKELLVDSGYYTAEDLGL